MEFLVGAWLKESSGTHALADVDEAKILDDVYIRYLRDADQRQNICSIAALSQFEIPVTSSWLGDLEELDSLRQNAFVESSVDSPLGAPVEFLQYFHSTPARYVVAAAFHKGQLAVPSVDAFFLKKLSQYLDTTPANFFDVFHKLYLNERTDLQSSLFEHEQTFQRAEKIIASLPKSLDNKLLKSLARFLYAVGRWEASKYTKTLWLLQCLWNQIGQKECLGLVANAELHTISFFMFVFKKIDPTVEIDLLSMIEFADLGKRSKDVGLATLTNFLARARQAGVDKSNLKAFCDELDFRALGKRSKEIELANIRTFLKKARQVGVDPSNLNDFCQGLDFRTLGKHSKDTGLASIWTFLQEARQAGVDKAYLKTFCDELDWCTLGEERRENKEKQSWLFDLHTLLRNLGISKEAACAFVEGLGWDYLKTQIEQYFSPDVLAAVRILLLRKCEIKPQELTKKGIDLRPQVIWFRAFSSRPCSDVNDAQKLIQANYLKYGLNVLRTQDVEHFARLGGLDLRALSVLSRNLYLADPLYFKETIVPILRSFTAAQYSALFRDADLRNLSIFLSHFNPVDGIFDWQLPPDIDFSHLKDSDKLKGASLEEICHLLFNFYYVHRADCAKDLASLIEQDIEFLYGLLDAANLEILEFFVWNLWIALSEGKAPALFNEDSLRQLMTEKTKQEIGSQESLLALIGTMHLSGTPALGEIVQYVDHAAAKRLCLAAAQSNQLKLIRLLGGLWAISSRTLPEKDKKIYLETLDTLRFNFEIPNQKSATERLKVWLREP